MDEFTIGSIYVNNDTGEAITVMDIESVDEQEAWLIVGVIDLETTEIEYVEERCIKNEDLEDWEIYHYE